MTTGIFLPDPQGLDFNTWAARVTEQFASYGIPEPFNESRWKDWACSLFAANALTQKDIPSPQGFTDWRQWASRFLETVR